MKFRLLFLITLLFNQIILASNEDIGDQNSYPFRHENQKNQFMSYSDGECGAEIQDLKRKFLELKLDPDSNTLKKTKVLTVQKIYPEKYPVVKLSFSYFRPDYFIDSVDSIIIYINKLPCAVIPWDDFQDSRSDQISLGRYCVYDVSQGLELSFNVKSTYNNDSEWQEPQYIAQPLSIYYEKKSLRKLHFKFRESFECDIEALYEQ